MLEDGGGASARPGGDAALGGAAADLHAAVVGLRHELAEYRTLLPDRSVAEDELDELDELAGQAARAGCPALLPDSEHLRHSLLLVAAVLGSVSALSAPLNALREAVEALAPPHGERR